MSIRDRIREWLGISDVSARISTLSQDMLNLHGKSNKIQIQLDAVLPGLGRVISKLDSQFARSEFDPQRVAESKALEEEVLNRLHAEAAARAPYNLSDQG